jgi:predicted O-methyltransferase YrrM
MARARGTLAALATGGSAAASAQNATSPVNETRPWESPRTERRCGESRWAAGRRSLVLIACILSLMVGERGSGWPNAINAHALWQNSPNHAQTAVLIAGAAGEGTRGDAVGAVARWKRESMSHEQWVAVDRYITDLLVAPDPALDDALQASHAAGLPPIAVSPNQGKLLHLLARVHAARSILELGTLGGYSTIWLARALPADGHLITLEVEPRYAEVARRNIARAGLAGIIEQHVGPAADTLAAFIAEDRDPFDLIFIDADKQSIPEYFALALELSRRGSLIITDNVVRNGALIDPDSDDPRVLGVRRFHELLAAEPRASATTIQTVGSKGYDGFTFALVIA